MAGETVKTDAVCLGIRPWSRTSHVTSWLTPAGRVVTVVKGAERPKSPFLGQYDLNYTCELVYYARSRGEVHMIRECAPIERRDYLRRDYRALVLAEYFRFVTAALAPSGPESEAWYELLVRSLDGLRQVGIGGYRKALFFFDRSALTLAGVWPGDEKFSNFPLDAEAEIIVLYTDCLDLVADTRRLVSQLIFQPEQGKKQK